MPKVVAHAIIWLEEEQSYASYAPGSVISRPAPRVEEEWLTWLATCSSFAFRGQQGHLTVRKESRTRHEEYWYAYRCQNRRTLKRYVGRTIDLALARLEEIAREISAAFASSPTAPSPAGRVARPGQHEQHANLPLLLPKLSPPRLHRELIARERLWSRLDESLEYPLTLLCAPAGSGKTTLVRQWIAARETGTSFPHVAWIALDVGDNDPTRFWGALLLATQTWYTSSEQHLSNLLRSSHELYVKTQALEIMLTAFLNDLARQRVVGLLILEDYHLINEGRIHETLNFFLAHVPETLHIVIITRQEPPLLLARLRANGHLNELRAAELRFTLAESATFLLEFALTPETLEHLDASLEGWAAGLRLLALSLQGKTTQTQIEHALASFRGSHRPILDYFVTEVLQTQPEAIQDFLLRTSVLSRLTPALCDAVIGGSESAKLLEYIERNNLFLEASDVSGAWYRYHALFAEAMQHEAHRRLGQDAFYALSHIASCWFEEQGLLSEAIEAALKARESARAASLIERFFDTPQIHENREYHTQRRWLEQLPMDLLEQSPLLCFGYATALTFDRNMRGFNTHWPPEQLEKLLRRAEDGWSAEQNLPRLGTVYAFRAIVSLRQGRLDLAANAATQALVLLPEKDITWRCSSLTAQAFQALEVGLLNKSQQLFQQVYDLARLQASNHVQGIATLFLSIISLAQGRLRQAARYYHEFDQRKDPRGMHPASILIHMPMTLILYEWNELDQLQQHIQQDLDLAAEFSSVPQNVIHAAVEIPLACLQHARGETLLAIQRLATIWETRQVDEHDFLLHLYQEALYWLVHFSLLLGDELGAQRWLNELSRGYARYKAPGSEEPLFQIPDSTALVPTPQRETRGSAQMPAHLHERKTLLTIRLMLLQGKPEDALVLLEALRPQAQAAGRGQNILLIKILTARVYADCKQPDLARQALLEAVEQGYPEGHQRIFLDEGACLVPLLHDLLSCLENEALRAYVRKLLRGFQPPARQQAQAARNISTLLAEPLSSQERRVLRLLVAGRSNAEIARELVVSVNTIRTQLQSIYRKLRVNNRRAASDLARHLRLG